MTKRKERGDLGAVESTIKRIDVPPYNTTFLRFPQINLLFVRIELNLLFVTIDQIILIFKMTKGKEEEEEGEFRRALDESTTMYC